MKTYYQKNTINGVVYILDATDNPNVESIIFTSDYLETISNEVDEGEAQILPYSPPPKTKTAAIDAINIAAGQARIRIRNLFVSPGYGTLDEYNNAALEVKKWRDAGSPSGDVPTSITSWAIPKGLTNEQAATDLETQEAVLRGKLDAVRTLRLAGVVAVDDAVSDWGAVAQPHIDGLNNYDPLA